MAKSLVYKSADKVYNQTMKNKLVLSYKIAWLWGRIFNESPWINWSMRTVLFGIPLALLGLFLRRGFAFDDWILAGVGSGILLIGHAIMIFFIYGDYTFALEGETEERESDSVASDD